MDRFLVEGNPPWRPTAFERRPRLGPVDEDVPHGPRGHRQEVRPVAPLRARLVHELEIGLVHERGRRERSVSAAGAELPMSNGAQLLIDLRNEPVERLLAPGPELG